MTLQQLRYLIAVAACGSISAAAHSLYVSQSSLSVAVRDLERETGVTIFERSNRGTTLTSAGAELMRYARRVVAQADFMEQRYARGPAGRQALTRPLMRGDVPAAASMQADVDARKSAGEQLDEEAGGGAAPFPPQDGKGAPQPGRGGAAQAGSAGGAPDDRGRPVIGIIPSFLPEQSACTVREHYTSAVAAAGGTPLILPLTSDTTVYETLFPLIDGFLLTGGQDISPARYGCANPGSATDSRASGKPDATDGAPGQRAGDATGGVPNQRAGEYTPTREEVECLVLAYAYQFDIPVLGICRGMQMINVFFGGTLHLDLAETFCAARDGAGPSVEHWQHDDYGTPTHFVSIVRASKLARILDAKELATNSMHHQGIRDLSPLLDAAAYGPDGLVEAVEVRDRTFMIGVQWHPELLTGAKRMGCLFSSLVREAEGTRMRRGHAGSTGLRTTCKPRLGQPQKACPVVPAALSISKADDDALWPAITFAEGI